jgi:hypothetical protein
MSAVTEQDETVFFEAFEISFQALHFCLEPGQGDGLHCLLFQNLLRNGKQDFLIFQAIGDKIRLDRGLGDVRDAAEKITDPLHCSHQPLSRPPSAMPFSRRSGFGYATSPFDQPPCSRRLSHKKGAIDWANKFSLFVKSCG